MKYKLSIPERVVLLGTIPKQADFITLSKLEDARKVIVFTDEEVKKHQITTTPEGNITWATKDYQQDIELGEIAEAEIAKELKRLDSEKQLTADHLSLYEKFVEKRNEKKD